MANALPLMVTTSVPPGMTPVLPATMPVPPHTTSMLPATTIPELPATMPVLPVVMPEPPAVMPELPAVMSRLPTMATGHPLQVQESYHPNGRAAVNRQINLELYASYAYLCMDFYFDRQDVALKHFGPFFLQHSRVEREQAERLRLQNKCGGRICLRNIRKPDCDRWKNGLKAMKCALYLEKSVNQTEPAKSAPPGPSKKGAHLCDFLEHHYLEELVMSIKEWSVHITNQSKLGSSESSLAEYLFDKLTLDDSDKN